MRTRKEIEKEFGSLSNDGKGNFEPYILIPHEIELLLDIRDLLKERIVVNNELKCQAGFQVDYSTSKFLVCKNPKTNEVYITAQGDFMEAWFQKRNN